MNILDYLLLLLLLGFAVLGWRKGFLETVGSILGVLLAAIIASRLGPYVASTFFSDSNVANFVVFLIIFLAIIKVTGLLFWLIGKIFQVITVLPFIATFDKMLGFILGFAEGIFICSLVLYFVLKYPVSPWLLEQMVVSPVTNALIKIAYIFIPLLPAASNVIKNII